ncbi:MAG: hypothetical protein Q4D79_07835 [Propionibacteriaceae bacterium]|nr:hypothetical protein [Propionibacteriaceae bacterium]
MLGLLGALFDVPGAATREALLGNVSEASGVSLDRLGALRGTVGGAGRVAAADAAGRPRGSVPASHYPGRSGDARIHHPRWLSRWTASGASDPGDHEQRPKVKAFDE